MAYEHGVKISEVATSVLPPVESSAGIPIFFGTAPVNMTADASVNKPILCYSYEEAVAALGYVPPVENEKGLKKFEYTLCQAMYSQFVLFQVAPVIFVNVLDPSKHKKSASATNFTLDAKMGSATVAESGILPESVTIQSSTGAEYVNGTDYVLTFDDDGFLVVSSLKNAEGAFLCETGVALTISAEKLDPSMVTADEIVGGVDMQGNKSGLELVNEVFPRFRLISGIIAAPGFSHNPTVAAVMATKASNINEHFKAISLVDVPTDTVRSYTDVAEWKNNNNIVDPMQVLCFPMLSLDGVVFNFSTQLAGLMGLVDSENDDVPYVTPSNHNLQCTASILEDGTEVYLGADQANYLNSQGVVTALNFIGGWKCWGSRTAVYPAPTDVKDAFVPIRRMFNWIGNTLVQSFWQQVDGPLTPRLINTIVDSANIWLNGLAAQQKILGGRVDFLESENSAIDLADGKVRFHVYVTPPSPARSINFVLEYDVNYLSTLFG